MNITYILGAGASCEALPIVNNIPERLGYFADQFKLHPLEWLLDKQQKSRISERYILDIKDLTVQKREYEKLQRFHKDILWLKDESEKHSSIDTFAKKLYLQENSNLKKLKYILSCFFLSEQVFNFDKRYDSFFASILDNLSKLPNNLRIISWNYDSQIEIAHSNFSNTTIEKTRKDLNIISKGNNTFDDFNPNEFSIFKVNGTTSVSHMIDGFYDIIPDFNIKPVSLISHFLEIYSSNKHWEEHEPTMSFAWETSKEEPIYKSKLRESIRNTDILVVIGYSFPFFNRKTDKFILGSMKNLSKVYIQDPYNSETIKEKVEGFFPNANVKIPGRITHVIDFKEKKSKDQFFIPLEF